MLWPNFTPYISNLIALLPTSTHFETRPARFHRLLESH